MKTKGIYFLYRVLQALALPLLLFYLFWRALRSPAYRNSIPQRFGFLPHSFRQTAPGAIWLHAVSVGEVLACVDFARKLRAAFPHTRLFVSTSTVAGRATAGEKLQDLAEGIFYAPVDYVWAVRRVLRTLQPGLVLIAETEIWPNLFREARRTGAGLAIVNGRISDRALPRYLRWRAIFPHVLSAVDVILAQTEEIRGRFLALGAPPDHVQVGGNFKYDFESRAAASSSPVVQWLGRVRPAKVWIAASTMPPAEPGDPDEDDVVIAAWRQLQPRIPGLALILVPRKPERFDVAASKLAAAGIAFERRTLLQDGRAPVLLLDTIGELSGLFSHADVVFMGGSLPHRGGHNILEPAFFGKPVIVGPHMENFQAIADEFCAAGAMVEIAGQDDLAPALERVLLDPGSTGEHARICSAARRGATSRAVEAVRALHSIPCCRPSMPWYAVLRFFALLWRREARRRAVRDYRRRRRLPVPVISVGNLTMGGAGKTPSVLRIVELLRERGRSPAILTRGYRRSSPLRTLILAPGASERPDRTGDEPQIFLRSAMVPVGIGSDRYETGSSLLAEFAADTIVLDDGFQHVKLARDVDVLLIDGIDPFGGGAIFPAGRLREPVAGIARANVVVITRADLTDLGPAIERMVRRHNPSAPILHARVEPQCWVENASGRRCGLDEIDLNRAGAFCGLGNPAGFLRTLESIGVNILEWVEFEDHHHYTADELRRMAGQFHARGVTAAVTTEKDSINFAGIGGDLLGVPLYWLQIAMRFDDDEALAGAILSAISAGNAVRR